MARAVCLLCVCLLLCVVFVLLFLFLGKQEEVWRGRKTAKEKMYVEKNAITQRVVCVVN